MSQSINRIWIKLNMNELNTEVNLGVGSKQVSHLCFIKPIGLFEVSLWKKDLEKKKKYVLLFSQSVAVSFESWMGDSREEMVWGRPSGRAGKKTWREAVRKPSGEALPCCKPRPRFQSIHNQQWASPNPMATPRAMATLLCKKDHDILIQVCISPWDPFSHSPAMLNLYFLRRETPSCNSSITHSL